MSTIATDCFTSRGEIGKKLKKTRQWSRLGRQTIICRKCKAEIEKQNFSMHMKTKHPKKPVTKKPEVE